MGAARERWWILCLVGVATAASGNPFLEEGRRLYQGLRYGEALAQLEMARRVSTDDPALRRELLDLLGRCQVIEGKRAAAEQTFSELLQQFPSTQLDDSLSPKILDVFAEVKRSLYPPPHVRLVPLPSAPRRPRVRVEDPWDKVEVLQLSVDGAAPVPLPVQEQVSFEAGAWRLEALSAEGARLAQLEGTRAAEPVAPVVSPWPRRLAWVGVATAVAAGVAGTVAQVSSASSRGASEAEPWADTGRALHARATTEAHVAVGLFAGAGAAGAAAAVLFFW